MNMINQKNFDVVVFDLGNVIFDVDETATTRYWNEITGHTIDFNLYSKNPYLPDFEKANITPKEYYAALCLYLNIQISYGDFIFGMNKIYGSLFKNVKQSIERIFDKVRVVALTNTNIIHSEIWTVKYKECLQNFNPIYSSSELHMRKPDPEIYSYILEDIGVDPKRVLYFDDVDANVTTAQSFGITSHLVKKPEDVCKVLKDVFDI